MIKPPSNPCRCLRLGGAGTRAPYPRRPTECIQNCSTKLDACQPHRVVCPPAARACIEWRISRWIDQFTLWWGKLPPEVAPCWCNGRNCYRQNPCRLRNANCCETQTVTSFGASPSNFAFMPATITALNGCECRAFRHQHLLPAYISAMWTGFSLLGNTWGVFAVTSPLLVRAPRLMVAWLCVAPSAICWFRTQGFIALPYAPPGSR